ncbi:hypothetical protein OH77DRAFT_1495811 [Trametes cingulata]|nr:hypothetical protein OH77DRAFT_1495811 [Trametes cingulata]
MTSTVSSYPRTRSQTRALPAMKRKNSEQSVAKAPRPAKMARRASSDSAASTSVDLSPEALAEPSASGTPGPLPPGGRTAWPPDVPRSMLFTFRLGEPAFHMYDGPKRSSTPDAPVSVPSDCPQFVATGPEPMFDHSWRLTFVEGAHTASRRSSSASRSAKADESLKCPFCPRTFSLPNGLAIHLKWHWGASGLEWKRGISRSGKTIERALRDAELRREEEARRRIEAEFADVPPAVTATSAHTGPSDVQQTSTSSSTHHRPNSSGDEGYPFTMPVIAQPAFEFPFFSSQSSATSVASESPYTSPVDAYPHQPGPFVFPPPVLAVHNASVATGPTPSSWSENLFGPTYDGEDADADAEGENDGDDDLLVACRGGVGAPRLGTMRLPDALSDDEDEDDEGNEGGFSRFDYDCAGDEDEDAGESEGSGGLVGESDGLAPLFGLPALQGLPELDAAFEGLAVF